MILHHYFIPLFSFPVYSCVLCWITLDTLLHCLWDGGKPAGTISISLKCGFAISIKTLSMAVSPCPQLGQCLQICHPGSTSRSPHRQLLQPAQSPPLPAWHLPHSPQWPIKNHGTMRCMSRWWAPPSALVLVVNPLYWILPVPLLPLMENEVGPHPGRVRRKSLNNAHRMQKPFPWWTLQPLKNMVPACLWKVTMTVVRRSLS